MDRSRRNFTWRPGLPSRRSAVGAMLITAAAVTAFSVAGGDDLSEPAWWLAADSDLRQGQTLSNGDLRAVPLDASDAVAPRLFAEGESLEGAVLLAPVAEGDLLARSAVRQTRSDDGRGRGSDGPGTEVPGSGGPDGYELTIEVASSQALGGDLRVGEIVEILATGGTGPESATRVAAHGALVLAASAPADDSLAGVTGHQVTLWLDDPEEALATAHAAQAEEITVMRAGGAIGSGPSIDSTVTSPDQSDDSELRS